MKQSKPDQGIELFNAWSKQKNRKNLDAIFDHFSDTISSAVHTYAGKHVSPTIHLKAKLLVAEALHKYNPNKGAPLKSYIYTQLQPLYRYASRQGVAVTLPERAYNDMRKVQQAETDLFDVLGREPNMDELADYSGMGITRIQKLNKKYRPHQVLGSFFESGDEDSNLHAPTVNHYNPQQAWSDYVYHDLDPINKKIYEYRTLKTPLANSEIAKRLKLSPSAVSQRAGTISEKLAEGGEHGFLQ